MSINDICSMEDLLEVFGINLVSISPELLQFCRIIYISDHGFMFCLDLKAEI